jgi:D-3-phosphoglycerate dehydrogenase
VRRIVITDCDFGAGEIEREELGDGFDVVVADARDEDGVLEAGQDAEGLLVQYAPISARVLAGLPGLRAVVRYGIGLDTVDLAAADRHGVVVHNVDDYCIDEVADHTAAFISAAARRILLYDRAVRAGTWGLDSAPPPLPPAEDPVGVVGFGRIGRAVAARLRAAGHPVLVWDPYVDGDASGDSLVFLSTLEELARRVNHLTLHCPLTAETRHLVDEAVLTALGGDGHLVNTGRGGLVDERALLAALDSGRLGQASLDVLSSEPPGGDGASLVHHPRVVATPHVAYLSTASLPRLRRRAAQRLAEALDRSRVAPVP